MKLLLATLVLSAPAFGAPFLIADVPASSARANQCVYTRGTPVASPIVVDLAYQPNGGRICKVDLAADPRTGTIALALRDSVAGDTGPAFSYPFPTPLSAPGNLRIVP